MRPQKIYRVIKKSFKNMNNGKPADRMFVEALAVNLSKAIKQIDHVGHRTGAQFLFDNAIILSSTEKDTSFHLTYINLLSKPIQLTLPEQHWLLKCVNHGFLNLHEKTLLKTQTKLNNKLFLAALENVKVTIK